MREKELCGGEKKVYSLSVGWYRRQVSTYCMEAIACASKVESGACDVGCVRWVEYPVRSASVDMTELKSPPTRCSVSGAESIHCTMSWKKEVSGELGA